MTIVHPPLSTLATEDQLLLCCARTAMDAAHAARLRELLAGPLDWARVLQRAEQHGLAPLAATHLTGVSEQVPAECLDRLRSLLRETQFRNLHFTGVLARVLARFGEAGVRALTYKGPALAQALYGNLALRPFGDVDVLLGHADVARAWEILRSEGFVSHGAALEASRAQTAGQFLFHDAEGNVLVELHSERTLRHFPRPLTTAWLLGDPVRVLVAGREVPTMAPAKLLIALAVHGTKDLWCRWKWVCDIAEFLRVHSELDWPTAFEEARRLGCERMVRLSLALARHLLGAELPAACAGELRQDPGAESLAGALLRRFSESSAELGASGRFFFRVNACTGTWEGLRYAVRLATTPAEEDWAAAPLPAPLYPFLRPFRLLRKYGVGRQ